MRVLVKPSVIHGNIAAPTSKSSMQRACAAALIRRGVSVIENPGHSNDDKAAIGVIKSLGANVEVMIDGCLKVDSSGFLNIKLNIASENEIEVFVGESGLGIRMFTPIIALSDKEITIKGEGSLLSRPMDFFDEVFPKLNVEIVSNKGKLPFRIKGPLQRNNITIDGSLSSQYLTGILFAYSAIDSSEATITVTNLKSKPYVDLTLKVMKDFGLNVPENIHYKSFVFSNHLKKSAVKATVQYRVESDWSGGAFLIVAGAINGNISVNGLDINSTQADKKIMEAIQDSGANFLIEENKISFYSSADINLKAFEFDATDCPDLFPPLAALAAYCKGVTTIKGVKRLTHKESNRSLTIQQELGKMGILIDLNNDVMQIHGGNGLNGANTHSHHDHRIAMMCAIAALKAEGETMIEQAEAVDKSYPAFWEDLKTLQAAVSYQSIEIPL